MLPLLLLALNATADPCGMVPPLNIAGSAPIQRIGVQRTWISHRKGIETMVLRPGFSGSIDSFGMLIPFPSPPAVRKVSDDTFAHLEAAIDPPAVNLAIDRLTEPPTLSSADGIGGLIGTKGSQIGSGGLGSRGGGLAYSEVAVVSQEAVGMYQVAVLQAGSAEALSRWMADNGYRYPEGMDDVANEYVADGWCFVAIKARIGAADRAAPAPGMRSVDATLPAGATFDGHVQGMGFRFRTEQPVVPMRLSVFNGEDAYNVVYMLSDVPLSIRGLDPSFVTERLDGAQLHHNLTAPLDLNITRGEADWLTPELKASLEEKRDPDPYVSQARDLIAADLLAARTDTLSLAMEEEEKDLLNISEALGLRGPEIDALHAEAIAAARRQASLAALDDVREMTLTVIAGRMPTALIRDENLTFVADSRKITATGSRQDPFKLADITGRVIVRTYNNQHTEQWSGPATQPMVPTVTQALSQVIGPRTTEDLAASLARIEPQIRYCYQRELTRQPELGGQVGFRVVVDAGGSVTSIAATGTIGSATVEQCIQGRIQRVRFSTIEDGLSLFRLNVDLSPAY
jgi:hypothetical protein